MAVTDMEYNDHDLLVIIAERTRVMAENAAEYQKRNDITVAALRADVDSLKLSRANTSGVVTGGKFFWGIVLAAPGLVLGIISLAAVLIQ
jgi:excinuclease UvrABC helicase subunit UvrB